MAEADQTGEPGEPWFQRTPWGRGDLLAILVWTVAVGWLFREAVTLRGALFYFDITEINYPYRSFFAERAARRPVLALVSLALLRHAALQREPGGVSAPAEVPALSLDGDLEGVQPGHRALGLADRGWGPTAGSAATSGPPRL